MSFALGYGKCAKVKSVQLVRFPCCSLLLAQECVSSSRAELEGVSRWEGEERTSEERWDSSLRTAAEKIKKLYT